MTVNHPEKIVNPLPAEKWIILYEYTKFERHVLFLFKLLFHAPILSFSPSVLYYSFHHYHSWSYSMQQVMILYISLPTSVNFHTSHIKFHIIQSPDRGSYSFPLSSMFWRPYSCLFLSHVDNSSAPRILTLRLRFLLLFLFRRIINILYYYT